MLKGKTVLVTGGAGFIGSHIVDRCLAEGADKIISYDNLVGGKLENHDDVMFNPRFEFVEGSICDYDKLKPYVEMSDIIFNEAASKLVVSLKDPKVDIETNVKGNFNLLEIIRKSGLRPRVIHASTGSVFGSSEKDFEEDDRKKPSTVYGISKLAAENYFELYHREHGLDSTVLRYFHVFGPRQDYSSDAGVISIFLSKVLKGEPPVIYSGGQQIRCFTYVHDVVDANFLVLKNDFTIGETYNVASKTRMSINDLAEKVISLYGHKSMRPVEGLARMGENMRPVPNTSKIEALGFREKVSFDQGLEYTRQYVESNL